MSTKVQKSRHVTNNVSQGESGVTVMSFSSILVDRFWHIFCIIRKSIAKRCVLITKTMFSCSIEYVKMTLSRGYYIAMRRYENSLLLLKNISTQDKKLNCVQVVMHSSIYYLFIKRLCRTIGEGLGTTELMNLIGWNWCWKRSRYFPV